MSVVYVVDQVSLQATVIVTETNSMSVVFVADLVSLLAIVTVTETN
jgi:hypothetical protein